MKFLLSKTARCNKLRRLLPIKRPSWVLPQHGQPLPERTIWIKCFDLTLADQTGKPVASRGKYLVVWRRQPSGEWKAAEDIFNTDQ